MARLVLDDPLLMELAAEDVCWSVAIAYWRRHQPPFWRVLQRMSWEAEGRRLREWRRRLVWYAEDAGLRIA